MRAAWSSTASALGQVLAINAVPLGGLALLGWSTGTTLALYWVETLVAVLLTGVRIAIHRRLTRKRGHWRPQLGLEVRSGARGTRPVALPGFLTEFLTAGLVFSAGHAIFLVAVLAAFLPGEIDLHQLTWGAVASVAVQLVVLATDLVGIRERPFAWIRERAQLVLGRTVLLHLALLGGLALLFWQGQPPAFFLPFAILKLLADLAAVGLGRSRPVALPRQAPGWLSRLAGDAAGERWRSRVDQERSLLAGDEEVGDAAKPRRDRSGHRFRM